MNLLTKRLVIRPLEPRDIDDIYTIHSDEDVCKLLLHEPWTENNKKEMFEEKLNQNNLSKDTALHLACVLGEKVIGDIVMSYTDMRDTIEIGYSFNKNYQGKGYAKEALFEVVKYLFLEVKVHRIIANIDARNDASAKLCENIGMRREAHFIQDYWSKGEWTDSYIYGMLISDLKMETHEE